MTKHYKGLSAAEASRRFDIPADRIRKWVSRNKVHRYPDGSIDLACLGFHVFRKTLTGNLVDLHASICHTLADGRAMSSSRH